MLTSFQPSIFRIPCTSLVLYKDESMKAAAYSCYPQYFIPSSALQIINLEEFDEFLDDENLQFLMKCILKLKKLTIIAFFNMSSRFSIGWHGQTIYIASYATCKDDFLLLSHSCNIHSRTKWSIFYSFRFMRFMIQCFPFVSEP